MCLAGSGELDACCWVAQKHEGAEPNRFPSPSRSTGVLSTMQLPLSSQMESYTVRWRWCRFVGQVASNWQGLIPCQPAAWQWSLLFVKLNGVPQHSQVYPMPCVQVLSRRLHPPQQVQALPWLDTPQVRMRRCVPGRQR